jgi:hypothetical protein
MKINDNQVVNAKQTPFVTIPCIVNTSIISDYVLALQQLVT